MIKLFKDPLVISFVFLVSVLAVFSYLKYRPQLTNKKEAGGLIKSTNQVSKIEMEDEQKTTLVKKDGKWLIQSEESQPADEKKVNDLLTGLEALKISEIVSQNPDNFENFNLNEKEAIKVHLWENENKIFEIWVGKAGPAFNKTYFRLPNKEEVYLSNISLRSKVIQTNWLQPTPTPEPTTTPTE